MIKKGQNQKKLENKKGNVEISKNSRQKNGEIKT